MIVESAEERSGRGQEGRHPHAFFYVDDGMVSSSDPRWLKGTFSTLVGLFDRVGLKTNIRNIVGMVCRMCQATGKKSEAAYGRRMTGAGPSYWKRQRGGIQCTEFRGEMAMGLLAGYMQTHHGREAERVWRWEEYLQDDLSGRRGKSELPR